MKQYESILPSARILRFLIGKNAEYLAKQLKQVDYPKASMGPKQNIVTFQKSSDNVLKKILVGSGRGYRPYRGYAAHHPIPY